MTATDVALAIDTVEAAAATPERDQPYAALGLRPDEYARIREILGRRPTSAELGMYSVMWSEHCSYKSSRVHLRRFGRQTDAGVLVAHDLTQEELAQLVGASRDTVNKALADFASRGWLRLEARAVVLLDVDRLVRRAR